jgi:hypothetical protein
MQRLAFTFQNISIKDANAFYKLSEDLQHNIDNFLKDLFLKNAKYQGIRGQHHFLEKATQLENQYERFQDDCDIIYGISLKSLTSISSHHSLTNIRKTLLKFRDTFALITLSREITEKLSHEEFTQDELKSIKKILESKKKRFALHYTNMFGPIGILLNQLVTYFNDVSKAKGFQPIEDEKAIPVVPSPYKQFALSLTQNNNPDLFDKRMKTFYSEFKSKKQPTLTEFNDIFSHPFIIAEAHSDLSPKQNLITLFPLLKEKGYTTFFMEHVYYDYQQELDYFCADATDEIPHHIKICLEKANRHGDLIGFGMPEKESQHICQLWNQCNFIAILKAAKSAGIRVVGIDTKYTYQEQNRHMDRFASAYDNYRIASMNYTAYHIIETEMKKAPDEKWVALMGISHVKTQKGIPGVSELTGARSLFIVDEKNKEQKCLFNHLVPGKNLMDFTPITVDCFIEKNPLLLAITPEKKVNSSKSSSAFFTLDAQPITLDLIDELLSHHKTKMEEKQFVEAKKYLSSLKSSIKKAKIRPDLSDVIVQHYQSRLEVVDNLIQQCERFMPKDDQRCTIS